MNVVLLCAGYATRLYPLTENTPKPLLPVAGKPMLEHILDRVEKVPGIERIFLVTNHKFAPHFEKWSKTAKFSKKIEVVDDMTTSNENRLGAIGDLAYTLKKNNVGAVDLMVLAGDNLFDFDLVEFIGHAKAMRPHGVIAVYDVKDKELAKQYGLVGFDSKGTVLEFYEKPANPPTTMASCGVYYLPKETRVLLDRYLAEGNNPDQPGHYMGWLVKNGGLSAVPLEGQWLDIGDLASYKKADEMCMSFRK